MPGFAQKYVASKGKDIYQILDETHKEIIKRYMEQEQKKKQEEEEKKYIKELSKEFAKNIQQELNKIFK